MTLKTWLKRGALLLGALLVMYFVAGGFYVAKVSQREEAWHEEAVANSVPATESQWLDVARQEQPRVELRLRSKPGLLYLVRIYEDRGYLSALHPGSSEVPPLHIETGEIARSEWRALRDLAERMYAVRETLIQEQDYSNPADARLTLVHENRQRVLYRYHTADYARLPQLLRDYDALLFETMRPWAVKPHHGHARPVPELRYGVSTIPALVRGLESPREELYASVVERLVDIGEPSLPELTRVLREGEQARYRPVTRYAAVVDGIGRLADASSEGYTLVKAIAGGRAATSSQKDLEKRAQEVVDRLEIEAYLAERWAVSPEIEALFGQRRLSPEQEAAALAEFRSWFDRGKPQRDTASDVLVTIGPDVLPVVLGELRRDRVERNLINDELLEVLGTLGGREAFFHAIRNDVVGASACVTAMHDLGADGVPGLLALLESGERYARQRAADTLSKPEYQRHTAEFGAVLEARLRAFRDMAPGAVRELQKDAAIRLIEIIRRHGARDDDSLEALVAAATDDAQDDRTRIAALEALGMLGERAVSSVPRLAAVAGYASGRVYETLKETLATLGGL